jgi:hypothetical protein
MNKLVLLPCILATTLAFAQFPWEVPPAEGASADSTPAVVQAPAPAPAPVPEAPKPAPAAPAEKTMFDVIRGHAYTPATLGAANNVHDLVRIPTYIQGEKFFYVAPVAQMGYTAFEAFGGSVLLGLDNSPTNNLAALKVGYATPSFGVALDYSVSKSFYSDSDTDYSERVTYPGDNLGLYFSMPLANFILYANALWLTYANSGAQDFDGDVAKYDFSTITLNAGLTGGSSLKWDGFLSFVRTGGSTTAPNGNKNIDANTAPMISASFNVGSTVLQNQTSRVIFGSNNGLGTIMFDKIPNVKSDYIVALVMEPNVLGEVLLFENWIGFAGASHELIFMLGNGDRNDKTTYIQITHSPGTEAFGGIRYQKTNWAVEARLAAATYNNPFAGFSGANVLADFGGFIYF